jgi:hypothetical protein
MILNPFTSFALKWQCSGMWARGLVTFCLGRERHECLHVSDGSISSIKLYIVKDHVMGLLHPLIGCSEKL